MRGFIVFFIFSILLLVSLASNAVEYYVAPDGNNSNNGSSSSPWLTIQFALDSITAGDTVWLKAGTYQERVRFNKSGSADAGYITLSAVEGDDVILDGQNLVPEDGQSAMISIDGTKYIKINNLEIRNYRTSNNQAVPIGIFITGAAASIQLLNNHVHDIEQNTDSSQGDAHAIAVYATDGNNSISNLLIQGNTINDCKLGSSEALVLNGNVENFTVTQNRVYSCNNIGIDLIGWEGVATANDQARNGTVSENTVYNISSYGNPAYGNERSAAGIYVDGGKDIVVERNRIYSCDFGIEVASEHQNKTTSGITVRNNLIYSNLVAGIAFGGYASDRGITLNCSFEHNTLFHNDTTNSQNGELMIQKANDNNIKNNIIYCSNQNIAISNYFSNSDSYDNTFDYNIYFSSGDTTSTQFIFQNKEYSGFASYQQATNQDGKSLFSDPGLTQITDNFDFHLQETSNAVNAGDPSFTPASNEIDFEGNDRILGGRTDCGAYEYKEGGSQYYSLTVTNGSGSGSYVAGEQVTVIAESVSGKEFFKWTGDTDYVDNVNSATAIITMPAKNIALTASYISSTGFYLTKGAVIKVTASELNNSLLSFLKKPKVNGTWDNNDNSATLKVVIKVNKNTPQESIYAEWTRNVRLYDKSDYKKVLLSTALVEKPVSDKNLDGIFVNYYDKQNDIEVVDKNIVENAYVANPVISAVSGNYSEQGDAFTVEGLYFGAKAPAILVEYLKNGDSAKPKYKKCKLNKSATYQYLDAKRHPQKSCMKIYSDDTTDNNPVGYCAVTVEYPKVSDKDQATGYIILDNKIGLTYYKLP